MTSISCKVSGRMVFVVSECNRNRKVTVKNIAVHCYYSNNNSTTPRGEHFNNSTKINKKQIINLIILFSCTIEIVSTE